MSGRFLFLKNTVGAPGAIAEPPNGHQITILDQYSFDPAALRNVDGLLLGQHLDERHLGAFRIILDAFFNQGGRVAVMGPIALPFMTCLVPHRPEGDGHREDWLLELANDHPVSKGISADDLTYRKGVVGFWARGCIAPPAEAVILTQFKKTGTPADWIWESGTGGKLFVHPGNDVWGYTKEPNTSARVFPQLLDWMAA